MLTIYKYGLKLTEVQQVDIPLGARLLDVQVQDGTVMLWALVDPSQQSKPRQVNIYGTGQAINPLAWGRQQYTGTVQLNGFVWHVFAGRREGQVDAEG